MTKRRKLQIIGCVIIILFALIHSKDEVSISGNDASRLAVVQALAEQNTFAIENTQFRTVDRLERNGHIYSDKPLPLPVLGALYFKIPHNLFGLSFETHYNLAVYLVTLLFGIIVNPLLFLLMFRLLGALPGKLEMKFLLALAMCLGSWLLSYSVVFNNHTPAALAVGAMLLLVRTFHRHPTKENAGWIGLAAGCAAAADLPTGAVFAVAAMCSVGCESPAARRLPNLAGCAAAGAAVGVVMLALNYAAYGTLLPLYIAGNNGTFSPGIGNKSYLVYSYQCLLGNRGLFSYQPFLLLAIPAAMLFWKKFRNGEKIIFGAAVSLIVFYLVFTNEFGGWAYGFRYLIPAIPVLWFEASRMTLSTSRKSVQLLATILILIGVMTGYIGSYSPFCPAYEGFRTPPGNVTALIPNTFESNLTAWGYENWPDAPWVRYLIERHGAGAGLYMLHLSYFNLKRPDLLARIDAELRRLPSPVTEASEAK